MCTPKVQPKHYVDITCQAHNATTWYFQLRQICKYKQSHLNETPKGVIRELYVWCSAHVIGVIFKRVSNFQLVLMKFWILNHLSSKQLGHGSVLIQFCLASCGKQLSECCKAAAPTNEHISGGNSNRTNASDYSNGHFSRACQKTNRKAKMSVSLEAVPQNHKNQSP